MPLMQITLELNETEVKQLQQLAHQRGLTISDLAREILLRETRLLQPDAPSQSLEIETEPVKWTVEFTPVEQNAFRLRILENDREIHLAPDAGVGAVRSGRGDLSTHHDDYFAEACIG